MKDRLALTEMTNFGATSITAIENEVVEKGIDQLKCLAQTYNGEVLRSGAVGGVQAHFLKQHLEVIYYTVHTLLCTS